MSGFKAFLYLFIALNFYVMTDCRRSQNQSGCVQVHKNDKFPFKFLHNINQSEWENAVHKIKNYTNDCLSSEEGRNCQKPFITITFPVISGNPRIPLQVLPRPFLATKGEFSSTAYQVLSAFGQIWKLFVFCLMAAAISGVMIWFLVSIITEAYVLLTLFIQETHNPSRPEFCTCNIKTGRTIRRRLSPQFVEVQQKGEYM